MQGWDYRLGINGVKRLQAAYNRCAGRARVPSRRTGPEDLRAVGGWPDAIGEDIVLTWTLMDARGIVQYEPLALSFTDVPMRLGDFLSQRSRWARGMFEGLRTHPPSHPAPGAGEARRRDRLPRSPARRRNHLLLGARRDPLALRQSTDRRLVVDAAAPDHTRHLRPAAPLAGAERLPAARHSSPWTDRRGFLGYLLVYQVLVSAAALRGYGQYLLGLGPPVGELRRVRASPISSLNPVCAFRRAPRRMETAGVNASTLSQGRQPWPFRRTRARAPLLHR